MKLIKSVFEKALNVYPPCWKMNPLIDDFPSYTHPCIGDFRPATFDYPRALARVIQPFPIVVNRHLTLDMFLVAIIAMILLKQSQPLVNYT